MKLNFGASLPLLTSEQAGALSPYPFIRHIQLKLPPNPMDGRMRAAARIRAVQSLGFEVSLHAWSHINLAEPMPGPRKAFVACALEALSLAADTGCPFVCLHAGHYQTDQTPKNRQKALSALLDSLDELEEQAADLGVNVHLENIYPVPYRGELIRLLDRADDYRFLADAASFTHISYCFDYGHALIDDRSPRLIREILPKTASLHLHGNNRLTDEHLAILIPGSPDFNFWHEELSWLSGAGFAGPCILESKGAHLPEALANTARYLGFAPLA